MVVLYEIDIYACGFRKNLAVITLQEETTRITEHFWLKNQDIWYSGINYVHCYLLLFC